MNKHRLLIAIILMLCVGCQTSFKYEPSPTRPSGKLDTNIIDFLKSRPDAFSLLSQAIDRAGLTSTLSSGTFTLFAPDDPAFKAFLGTKKLEDIPVEDLRKTLLLHLLDKKVLSQDLTLDITPYPSQLTGRSVNLSRNVSFTVTVNGNRVFVSNLEPTNGAIHVIPAVLR
ncbi:fasciclin domain-containing protein [Persicitalea sp.]|uniref:fasciclin domain-containing protein n=1 Tax=Persicitalea sp. TaxID=3100273 RepID=UPI0035934B07